MKKFLPGFFVLLLFLASQAIAAPASTKDASKPATQVINMVLSLGDPEDSEMGILGIAFKNYISQHSNGKMQVELGYSGGFDIDESYQFRRVQAGKLAMALGGVGNLVPMVQRLGVVTLPYLFPDTEAVVRGTTGKAAEILNSYAEAAGFRILAWTYYGYRFLSNSKKPIKSLEDMRRLKFRVPQNIVMVKTYRAFGAIPTPLAWPVTRNSLKNDIVDGQCYDYSGFRAMKFHDVGQKYITELHYLYNLQPLVINNHFFNALSKEDQNVLIDAGQHIQQLSLQYQKEMNAMAKKALQAEGVHVTVLDDESPWRDVALARVWPEVADNIGGEKDINTYLEACGLPLWKPEESNQQ